MTLEDGRAVVNMQIKDEYKPIYKDATILLRPKTGLKDMILALDPGTRGAGELEEGGRVTVANTLPDVNADEVLSTLDADTRAYLRDPDQRRGHRAARRRDRRPARARRPTCARRSSASSPRRATPQASPSCSRSGARNISARSTTSGAVDRAGRQGRPARGAGGLGQRELRGVRPGGVGPARGAAAVPEHPLADGDHAQPRGHPGRRARADARGGCVRSRASWRRPCAPSGRSCATPRRSSATRCVRSRVTSSRRCATCAPQPRTWRRSRRSSRAASRC